ncbi:hypothetical protein JL720_2669 [Aureococcus anophagefferens]|nr:hypothetical protein JL720_2669 [Aureococcus anophagefferens]
MASSAFLRLEGEGVAVPPDAVAYVSARGGAPVPAPRSRLVQEDCEIRFELPESDIAVILEYTQSDGRRRHHNFALAKPQTIQWVVDDWKKNLGVAVPPEAVAYVSERGATCAPVPRSRLVCKDCEIVFKEADTAGAELVVVVTDESAGIAASPPGFASLTARGVELGGRRWAGSVRELGALICAFPFEPKDAHTARVYVACEPCSLDRDAVVAAFDAARKIDGVYERVRPTIPTSSRLGVDNVLRRMTISEFVAMYVSKNETRVTRLVVAATPLRKSFARRLIDLRGPRMIRLKVICEDAAVGDGRFPPLLRGPTGARRPSLGDEPPIVVFVTDEKTGDVLLARSIAGTEACLWFTLHDVWTRVDLVLRVGNGSGELFRDDLLATFPVPDVINEPSLQDIIVFIFEHRTVGGRLGREFRSVLQMPETRVTLDGVELAPGALQSPLDRSLVQPLALHTPEGEPIVISVLSDEFGERFRRDLAPADDLGTFLVLAKDARGPLWDVLRCPAADNHASVKDAVEDVLEMPGALDAEGASFVGETQLIEDPASVSVAFLTQRSELARIGDPPFACVVADFPGSTLRAGTRLDVAILHGDDKKDLLKFDGIEPTIHRLHAGGEISEKIYDHLCDDVVCEVEEARSIRIAVDGGPERDIDYDDHLGALLGPSPPERVAVTVWLDDRRKKVPRTQWTKLQHGCWATMAKERVMRGEFIYELDCWKRLTVSGTALASVYCVGESAFLEVGVALGLFPWPARGDVDDEEVLSKVFDVLTIAANHAAAARGSSWAILYKNHAGFPTARHPDMDQPLHSGILSLLKLRKLPELLTIAAKCADAPAARRKLVLGLVGLAAPAAPSESSMVHVCLPSVVLVLLAVLNQAAFGNKPSCTLFGETFDTRPLLDALGRLPVALLHDVKLDWRAYDPEQRATFERALLGLLVLWHLVRPSENYAEQVELAATVEGHDAYRGAVSGAVALQLQMELSKVPRAKEASLRFRRTLQRKHAPEAVLAFVSANIPAGVARLVDLFSQPLGFGNGDRLIVEKAQLEAQTELPAPKNVGDDAAAKKKKKTRRGGKKKQAGASAPRDADPLPDAAAPRETGAKDKTIDAVTVGNDAVYSEPAFDPNCAERFRVGRIASSWAGGVCAVATNRRGGLRKADDPPLTVVRAPCGLVGLPTSYPDRKIMPPLSLAKLPDWDTSNPDAFFCTATDIVALAFATPAHLVVAEADAKKSLYVASAVAIHSISVEHDERFFGLSASDLAENDRRVADGGAFVNCAHCRRYDPERSLVCLGCRRVRYCDATCQRAAWAEHRHHCPASSSFAAGQATPAASRPDDGEATDGEAAPPPPRETDGAAAREIRVHVSVNGAIVKTEVCDFSKYPLDVPISRVTDAFPASVSAIQTLDGAPLPETTRAAEILERHGGDVVLILDFASMVTART